MGDFNGSVNYNAAIYTNNFNIGNGRFRFEANFTINYSDNYQREPDFRVVDIVNNSYIWVTLFNSSFSNLATLRHFYNGVELANISVPTGLTIPLVGDVNIVIERVAGVVNYYINRVLVAAIPYNAPILFDSYPVVTMFGIRYQGPYSSFGFAEWKICNMRFNDSQQNITQWCGNLNTATNVIDNFIGEYGFTSYFSPGLIYDPC